MVSKDGATKIILLHFLALITVGTVAATVRYQQRKNKRKQVKELVPTPLLRLNSSGRVEELERFSHYVARQMGFKDASQCPQFAKLALEFLRKTNGHQEKIFAFFEKEKNVEALYVKLMEELEKCVLGYFAFHWDQAPLMISQAPRAENEPKRKLRNMVLDATRKQRFEKVTKNLKVTRVLSTLVEEMKAIGIPPTGESHLMVPMAHSDRSPVLLLMGGGMGAGKSTVLKEIMKEAFWSGAEENAVVVEADAFKETDVIYRAINSFGHHNDIIQTAELVHQSSTDAAASLLVTALNEGRDVIMDGTLSWEPYVQQTIAMARNVHRQKYRMGVGYKVAEDGTVTENYWEPVEEDGASDKVPERKPYRIELVGVVCDPYLAVVRGIRRAIIMGRAVRVKSQLMSHKKFASAFESYCDLVDNARLFSTNTLGSAKLIGWKDGSSNLLVEPKEYDCIQTVRQLNENATSIYELYPGGVTVCGSSSIWTDMVASLSRVSVQSELKATIQAIESRAL